MRWRLAVFALSLLVVGGAQAQCSGTFNQTVTGASGASLTISAGQRVRIAPGANQTGAINSMGAGSELCIDAGAGFNAPVYGSNGLIRNYAADAVINGIGMGAGASVANHGTMTFNSYFSVNAAVSISNQVSARLVINPYIGLVSGSSLSNQGSLTFGGQFALNNGATFTNDNRAEIATSWQPSGTVNNNGFINGFGQISIEPSGTLNNTCWLYTQSTFYNSGTIQNSGAIRAFGNGAWQNSGSLTGTTTSWVVGVNFQNGGSGVSGYGTYRFSGTTNNYAAFVGSSAATPILFYDTTQTGSQIMDAQYPPPVNTVRPATDPGAVDPATFTPQPCAPPYLEELKIVNLSVEISNNTDTVAAGGTTSYDITVTNDGPSSAGGSVLRDPVVSGLNCTAAECAVTGGGAVCPANVTPATLASGQVIDTLPAASSLTFTVMCSVTATGLP